MGNHSLFNSFGGLDEIEWKCVDCGTRFQRLTEKAAHDKHCKEKGGAQTKATQCLSSWQGQEELGEVVYLPKNASLPITLNSREYEVFTVVPVKKLSDGASFAPIGLIKMFNSGGAIKDLRYKSEESRTIDMKVRGCGTFGAYSSVTPKRIRVDKEEVDFQYDGASGMIRLELRTEEEELFQWNITIQL